MLVRDELVSVEVVSDEVTPVLDNEVSVELVAVEEAVVLAMLVVEEAVAVEEVVLVEVAVVFVAVRPVPPPQAQQTSVATLPNPAGPRQPPSVEKMRS
mmetsp:Transcript_69794/g.194772  ORF Transcript_69794/g.194772 Transcript_69794/m.194772 type:complete len:98 (+) Transcript_69794:292-585(+)